MPRVVQHISHTDVESTLEDESLKRLFVDARSDFERCILSKRKIFERYLETRVNWLRMELTREGEATDSLDLNHLEFLRSFKSHLVPAEYRLTESEGKREVMRQPAPLPPSSALRVIKTVRRVATRSRINHGASSVKPSPDGGLANSTPFASSAKMTPAIATRTRNSRTLNLSKVPRLGRYGKAVMSQRVCTRRAAAIAASSKFKLSSTFLNQSPVPQKPPFVSVFDRDSVLYTSSGSPVANPFAHLTDEVVKEIKRILSARKV